MEDDEGKKVEYFSCPLLFIPPVVHEFLAMREYLETYPHTAPSYRDQDPRYLAFDRYFTGKVNEFRTLMKTTGGVT